MTIEEMDLSREEKKWYRTVQKDLLFVLQAVLSNSPHTVSKIFEWIIKLNGNTIGEVMLEVLLDILVLKQVIIK